MAEEKCYHCSRLLLPKWTLHSETLNKNYHIYRCPGCSLWQIFPIPKQIELNSLYEKNYFSKRTKRGYDNYLSEEVKKSIESTFVKNLKQLGFFIWEKENLRALEIGAAGGHFLNFLQQRKWKATGIDVSKEMTEAAAKKNLDMIHGDFLKYNFKENFDLVVLWATLEHLPDPLSFLIKIKEVMNGNGRLYLSTANTGFWARIYKENWRYLNVPEHIFYFNKKNLSGLLDKAGLKLRKSFTYGSGFTYAKNKGLVYNLLKKIFDQCAKYFHTGDMIVLEAVIKNNNDSNGSGSF